MGAATDVALRHKAPNAFKATLEIYLVNRTLPTSKLCQKIVTPSPKRKASESLRIMEGKQMTIPKNTNKAKQAIANAHNIRCYSLSNNFSGEPLVDNPGFYGGPVVNGQFTEWLRVSQPEFLAHELNQTRSAKLSRETNGTYCLRIHSNLWYDFAA